jgi:hypothetical protein
MVSFSLQFVHKNGNPCGAELLLLDDEEHACLIRQLRSLSYTHAVGVRQAQSNCHSW